LIGQEPPVNLDLMSMRFPVTALVSIGHRISGVIVFLALPLLLYFLSLSLVSVESFLDTKQFLSQPMMRFLLWGVGSAFLYHLIAGVRHLLLDMGVGESLRGGHIAAYIVFVGFSVMAILLGIWLW